MAHPADPAEADRLRAAARASAGSLLFDFVEVFNPRIVRMRAALARLRRHADFRLARIHCERSKDREDARNPRNHKRMVPIQYQETAHCLAALLFALDLTAELRGGVPERPRGRGAGRAVRPAQPRGLPLWASSTARSSGEFRFDGMTIAVRTDFKRRRRRPFQALRRRGGRRRPRLPPRGDLRRRRRAPAAQRRAPRPAAAAPPPGHRPPVLALAPRPAEPLRAGRGLRLARLRHVGGALGELPPGARAPHRLRSRAPGGHARLPRQPRQARALPRPRRGTKSLITAALSSPPQPAAIASSNSARCSSDAGTRAPVSAARPRMRPTSLACCASRATGRSKSRDEHARALGLHHLRARRARLQDLQRLGQVEAARGGRAPAPPTARCD